MSDSNRSPQPRVRSMRRAAILPIVVVSMVSLCGFVALAVDVGMVAVAKTESQNAADAGALAGARSIDGSVSPNLAAATSNARDAAIANPVLSTTLTASNVTVTHGAYHYNTTTETFAPQIPVVAPNTHNLTRVTVAHQANTSFARLLGTSAFNVVSTAIAAHRPRDVSIILDFSGSMNDESDLWNSVSTDHLGSLNGKSNSSDPDFPKFGHYSDQTTAALRTTSTDPRTGNSNVSQSTLGIPALVDDFFQHSRGGTAGAAFTAAPSLYATVPGGDLPMNKPATTTPAKTVQEVTGASSAAVTGKTDPVMTSYPAFKGYTQGPEFWGKTFFTWPPDPNYPSPATPSRDWRMKFFNTTDNTKLWETDGDWRTPSGNYTINYTNILAWIKSTPNPFPARLRGGRVLYYDSIPTTVPTGAYSSITNPSERFWREYIDYVVGVWTDPNGLVWQPGKLSGYDYVTPACSMGPDYVWGTPRISGPYATYAAAPTTRMHPQDNPKRPRHRLWFGPMTMIQFMADTGLMPGTAHDIAMYPAKLGISGALQDIKNNHPNDLVSMILYSRPQFSDDPAGTGRFNGPLYSLSRDYTGMIDSLWFPKNSGTSDVRPWDANDATTPRANHDYANNTTTIHGLMLAYNQFSGNSGLRGQLAGGLGRKGAQRLVILETDGMANQSSVPSPAFSNAGAGLSYYPVRAGDSVQSGAYSETALLKVVQAICNKADGTPGTAPGYSQNPGYPGFAQTRKPVLIHTIGFGAIMEPTSAGADQTEVVSLLQAISRIGGTIFPSSSNDATNGYKWCIGTLEERKTKLRQAFSTIMDDGISVTLVQ